MNIDSERSKTLAWILLCILDVFIPTLSRTGTDGSPVKLTDVPPEKKKFFFFRGGACNWVATQHDDPSIHTLVTTPPRPRHATRIVIVNRRAGHLAAAAGARCAVSRLYLGVFCDTS